MTFFFDNNLGQFLVRGLKEFGEHVCHITEHFDADTDDEEWLEYVGERGMFLVTRDEKIRKRPVEWEALKRHKVGAFFLGGKHMGRWAQIKQVIRAWQQMKDIAGREHRPFAYRVNFHGTKVKKMSVG